MNLTPSDDDLHENQERCHQVLLYSRSRDCGIQANYFEDQSQILTQWETVLHPKFVKEMHKTSVYPLNAVNTPVFYEKTIFLI